MDYSVNLLDGFVDLNTLSPDSKYFYRITKPIEIRMSVFGSRLAFLDVEGNILFCTANKSFALWMPPFETFRNVYWSQEGNFALFTCFNGVRTTISVLELYSGVIWEKEHTAEFNFQELISAVQNDRTLLDYLKTENYAVNPLHNNYSNEYSVGFFYPKWFP